MKSKNCHNQSRNRNKKLIINFEATGVAITDIRLMDFERFKNCK